MDLGVSEPIFREFTEKTVKKTRKRGKQRFFCLFWLTKRPAVSILTFAPLHFWKLVGFATTRTLKNS